MPSSYPPPPSGVASYGFGNVPPPPALNFPPPPPPSMWNFPPPPPAWG
jgi:hypothetical protein